MGIALGGGGGSLAVEIALLGNRPGARIAVGHGKPRGGESLGVGEALG